MIQQRISLSYDADKLSESKAEFDFDFHAHILDGPYELVVAAEEVSNQSFFVF